MSDSFLLASNINATVCLCLGWPANLLLIWLIRNKTVQAMQVWSRVLLQAALIDLLLLLVTFMSQPVFINDGNLFVSFLIGPFAQSNLLTVVILFYLYTFCSEFAKYAMAVQFIYRWLVICRERKLSLWHYTMLLFIPAVMTSALVTFMILNRYHNSIPNASCSTCPQNHTIILAILLEDLNTKLITYLLLFFIAATYAVISAISLHIWHRSRHALMSQQHQSREIRGQIGYVLLVQAALPLAFSLMPIIILYFQIIFGLQHQEWVSLFFTQCWPSVLYPMATILIVGPYRKWLFGLFQGIFGGRSNAVIVNPSNGPMTTVAQQIFVVGRQG